MIKESVTLNFETTYITGYDKVFVKIWAKSDRNILFSAWIDRQFTNEVLDVITKSIRIAVNEAILKSIHQLPEN